MLFLLPWGELAISSGCCGNSGAVFGVNLVHDEWESPLLSQPVPACSGYPKDDDKNQKGRYESKDSAGRIYDTVSHWAAPCPLW